MHILIVEDDETLASNLLTLLTANKYQVTVCRSLDEAQEAVDVNQYDLVLLDSHLPDGEGEDIIVQLRQQALTTPIIMITAKSQVEDIVNSLDLGADDYITKPFALKELLSRMNALIRRSSSSEGLSIITVADLCIDTQQKKVSRSGVEIQLAPREYAMLEYLAHHARTPLSRLELLHHVWGEDVDAFSNTVDVHIRYLRKKIDEPFDKALIQTVKNTGYMLCEE